MIRRIILLSMLVVGQLAIASNRDEVDVDVDTGDVGVTTGPVTTDVGVTTGPVTNELSSGDVIGGDTNIDTGGNVAIVAPNMGDVDIAQCLGSTQWTLLVGGKQKLVLNWVCMAEFYLKEGKYALAAQALCNQPELLEEYEGKGVPDDVAEQRCEGEHTFGVETSTDVTVQMANMQNQIDMLRALLAETQMNVVEHQEQAQVYVEDVQKQLDEAPRVAQAQVPNEILEQMNADAKRRAAAREILQQSTEEEDEE